MSIYKFNFNEIKTPELISSDYFKSMFSKQQEEYKQIYEILYNLYAESNIISYYNNLNDMNIENYLENIKYNKTIISFKNIDQIQLDESTNNHFNNATVDPLTNLLVSKKILSKQYDITRYYSTTLTSANNSYLTKPTEIYSNQANINENILSVIYEYNPTDSVNYTSLILDIKKTTTTDVLNTIILNTYPLNYCNYLYSLAQGKNQTNIVINPTGKEYKGGNVIFNDYDYSLPYYLPIADTYLDYVKFDIRNRASIQQSNKKISLIGIKNIYFESNTYAQTSHYAFNLFDAIDMNKYANNKITKIKLNGKSYAPLIHGQCSIKLFNNLDSLYSNTSIYDSNFYPHLTPPVAINVNSLSEDTICLITMFTNDTRSTNIVKNIEISWENGND